jgi:hypothetical protein
MIGLIAFSASRLTHPGRRAIAFIRAWQFEPFALPSVEQNGASGPVACAKSKVAETVGGKAGERARALDKLTVVVDKNEWMFIQNISLTGILASFF